MNKQYHIWFKLLKDMKILILTILTLTLFSCKKKGCTDIDATNYSEKAKKNDGSCIYNPKLIIKVRFDSTQVRLDNFGNPIGVGAGNSAQSPVFHKMGLHYIELAQSAYTQLGDGEIIYQGDETTQGGDKAVIFDNVKLAGNNETIMEIPLKNINPSTFKWLRVSLNYQNYDIDYTANGIDYTGRLASFVGFNTYISNYTINTQSVTVNANKLQGYWGFETLGTVSEGQAPQTTVPNPLSATSPIPAGSCVVTSDFSTPFVVSGKETKDIILTLSFSTNKSFEWVDANSNGKYEPLAGEAVIDMGSRGLDLIFD